MSKDQEETRECLRASVRFQPTSLLREPLQRSKLLGLCLNMHFQFTLQQGQKICKEYLSVLSLPATWEIFSGMRKHLYLYFNWKMFSWKLNSLSRHICYTVFLFSSHCLLFETDWTLYVFKVQNLTWFKFDCIQQHPAFMLIQFILSTVVNAVSSMGWVILRMSSFLKFIKKAMLHGFQLIDTIKVKIS